MSKYLRFYFLFLICIACKAQNQYDSTQHAFQNILSKYLQKNPSVGDYIVLSEKGIFLFASSQEKQVGQHEFELSWENVAKFQKFIQHHPQKSLDLFLKNQLHLSEKWDTSFTERQIMQKNTLKPLAGVRIALDAGHIAPDFETAKIEGKFIEMELEGKKIKFFEAELTWITSKILEKKLKDLGAEVFLTRPRLEDTGLGMSFKQWLEAYAQKQPKNNGKKPIIDKQWAFYHLFQKMELETRAKNINAFQPDLTLIIHYNVDANNKNWKKTVDENYAMAFVGGAFEASNLTKKELRFHLLRLLLTSDLHKSVTFSKNILENIESQLKIKPINKDNNQNFLTEKCLFTGENGIYARNLTLATQVFGTLCYIEPLYQDNVNECLLLNAKDGVWEGRKIPKRVEQVAEAYLNGILAYLQNK